MKYLILFFFLANISYAEINHDYLEDLAKHKRLGNVDNIKHNLKIFDEEITSDNIFLKIGNNEFDKNTLLNILQFPILRAFSIEKLKSKAEVLEACEKIILDFISEIAYYETLKYIYRKAKYNIDDLTHRFAKEPYSIFLNAAKESCSLTNSEVNLNYRKYCKIKSYNYLPMKYKSAVISKLYPEVITNIPEEQIKKYYEGRKAEYITSQPMADISLIRFELGNAFFERDYDDELAVSIARDILNNKDSFVVNVKNMSTHESVKAQGQLTKGLTPFNEIPLYSNLLSRYYVNPSNFEDKNVKVFPSGLLVKRGYKAGQPIATSVYDIIKINKYKAGKYKSYNDAKGEIKKELLGNFLFAKTKPLMGKYKKNAKITGYYMNFLKFLYKERRSLNR